MPRPSAHSPSPVWLFLLGAVLALFGSHAGRYWDFTVDDAGISFAYARHLAHGHGLVLTPGAERVEAATNLLWCLLLVPAESLGLSHELLAKLLGLAGASLALVAIGFFPSVAYQRAPRYYDLLAPLITAFMPHFALWSVSGLENGFFSGLAASALLALAHEENHPERFPWSAVLLSLLFATRPDGVLYAAAIGGAKLLRQLTPRSRRQDLLWALVLLLGFGALELFRLAYFAWPWPNSFYTKKRTFDFGKDLFDPNNPGLSYVGRWLLDYKLTRVVPVVPLVLFGLRAPVARIAVLGFVCAALFFPIYSHGDWMEEYRFLTFGAPFISLAIAEGGRAVVRTVQLFLPRNVRTAVAMALMPMTAYVLITETTRHYPERLRQATHHQTLEMSWVQNRARYFVRAGQRLNIDRRPSLLDPDVGGTSYDGRLQVIDLFGLGDIPIAQTHPDNPPGSREAIFWERRPTFVHLHGAWFAAMELHRLEELEQGYLRLPSRMPEGESDPDANYVRRETIAAPWYVPAERHAPQGITGTYVDGYTVSHQALDPGGTIMVEVTLANVGASSPGTLSLVPPHGATLNRSLDVPVQFAGGLIEPEHFLPGERPRARAWFRPPRGRYQLQWHDAEGHTATLGTLLVEPGAGSRESRTLRETMDRLLRDRQYGHALRLARTLALRVVADPRDSVAREALAHYGQALAERARVLADGGAFRTAALLAREARTWAADDPHTLATIHTVAERLAEEARRAERQQDLSRAFTLAREAVLTDPRRSWSRRRAERLRPHQVGEYDGGRDQAAYRFATAALAARADMDRALIFLGSVERWIEAAALAERTGHTPTDPRARVVVARGLISRGQALEALALVSGVPCASAHDPELTRALRAALGRPYRPGDTVCETPPPVPPPPFDPGEGSFEQGRWSGWTVSGHAFGARPTHARPAHQSFVNGWRGWYYANSFAHDTDDRTGTLRSRPFTISTEGISFLVGGGSDVDHVGVRLVIDGNVVLRAAGRNDEGLRRVFWDVRQYRGRQAVIEIYDEATGPWGHVLADDFRLEPVLPPETPTEDSSK